MKDSPLKTGVVFCSLVFIRFEVLWAVAHLIPPVPSIHVGFHRKVAMIRILTIIMMPIPSYFSLDVSVG
ncbi:hypothetical protein BDR07DRAFT_1393089 [Suillus spraguei]|nr:hypothetical protein BDR07DRAFT_1393089 [Suillus spraguei]